MIIIFIIFFSITFFTTIYNLNVVALICLLPVNAFLLYCIFKEIDDRKNEKKSEICYGYVIGTLRNEMSINKDIKLVNKDLDMIILIYIPSKNITKIVKTIIDDESLHIEKNTYLKTNYYDGKIFSFDIISQDNVPDVISEKLISEYKKLPDDYVETYGSVITNFSDDIDEMIIESEKYKNNN